MYKRLSVFFLVAANLVIFSSTTLCLCKLTGKAANVTANENDSFYLTLLYPDNQLEQDAGYFYIDAIDGYTQELHIKVHNVSKLQIYLSIETADCYTSPEGDLVYISGNPGNDVGFTDSSYALSGNIEIQYTNLTLPAGAEQDVMFTVYSPVLDTGEMIGAVRFSDITKPTVTPDSSVSNIQLNIRKAMTIPIRLRFPNTGSDTSPAIILGDAIVTDNGVFMTLSNNLPTINRNAYIHYDVTDNKGSKCYSGEIALIKMAPKTRVRVPVSLGANVKPGNYRLDFSYLTSADNSAVETRMVTFTKPFQPTTEPSNPITGQDSGSLSKSADILVNILSVIIVLLVILVVILLIRKRKH